MSKLIVDCDPGIDDTWALLLFLASEKCRLLGITCVNGNTTADHACRNARYLLAKCGRTDIPVYKGAKNPIVTADPYGLPPDFLHYHGLNGFGDIELPPLSDMPPVQNENAIVALNKIAAENKGELTVVCLGPLTNIALTIRTYTEFVNNVKEFLIMGGNYTAAGNTTMCAEFNFFTDPEAAHVVLSSACGKITILPWETCLSTEITYEWRQSLTKGGNKVMAFMDQIEASILERAKRIGLHNWVNCDQLLASIVLERGIIQESSESYATVELHGSHTRGQVVIGHLTKKKPNVIIVKKVNKEKHMENLWALKTFSWNTTI